MQSAQEVLDSRRWGLVYPDAFTQRTHPVVPGSRRLRIEVGNHEIGQGLVQSTVMQSGSVERQKREGVREHWYRVVESHRIE